LPIGFGGNISGSVITQFDENGCKALLISDTYHKAGVCSGQYEWTYSTINKLNGLMVKIDANPFLV